MKRVLFILLFIDSTAFGQLTIQDGWNAVSKYQVGSYSYHQDFIGHAGYGAPIILTSDGGLAVFGDGYDNGSCGLLVKLDRTGKEEWKKCVRKQYDEMESQSVVQDKNGNFYVFMLSYDHKRYRGGTQRIVYFTKTGIQLWDKTFGTYSLLNSPTFAYIKALDDGRITLRGQVVKTNPRKVKIRNIFFGKGG